MERLFGCLPFGAFFIPQVGVRFADAALMLKPGQRQRQRD
tara:strand:+ start:316 stop:435 length:120 start_codon:yes stop_codon:yes gene_type:complete